jgi:hypothetical protein
MISGDFLEKRPKKGPFPTPQPRIWQKSEKAEKPGFCSQRAAMKFLAKITFLRGSACFTIERFLKSPILDPIFSEISDEMGHPKNRG